jgi:molybdopterin converting factor small subunit
VNALEFLVLLVPAVGAGTAIYVALRASREYVRQGAERQTQLFLEMRRRLDQSPLAEIAEAIDLEAVGEVAQAKEAAVRLAELGLREKRAYVGLFEEVAILLERSQIDASIVHYMFGYYALMCAESHAFWGSNINRLSPYWSRFFEFVDQMESEREAFLKEGAAVLDVDSAGTIVGDDEPQPGLNAEVRVRIPPVLRMHFGDNAEVAALGTTVEEVLIDLDERYPGIGQQIFASDEDEFRVVRYVNVYVNDEDITNLDGHETTVSPGDMIMLLPAMAGGEL